MSNRVSTSVFASFFAVSLFAGALPLRAQAPVDSKLTGFSSSDSGVRFDADQALESATALEAASLPPSLPAPDPVPAISPNSAARFAAAWVLGAAGSFGGGYLGCLATCFDEGDDVAKEWVGLGVGSTLGSGVLAGAVNGSLGRGLVGGLLGFGAGVGAMYGMAQLHWDEGWPILVTGAAVQGLVAAVISASGK